VIVVALEVNTPWGWENWGFENTEGEMLTAFHIAVMFTFFGQAGVFFGFMDRYWSL